MNRVFFSLFLAGVVAVALINSPRSENRQESQAAAPKAEVEQVPVEADMHDFMEDYFQTPFRRLEKLMRKEPEETRAWKELRSDVIILAESGNLLVGRHAENADAWDGYSIAVREHGTEMYKSSKEKDFAKSKEHFTQMIDQCNACHKEFADGKHQLRVR